MKRKWIYALLTFSFFFSLVLNFSPLPAREQTKIPVDAETSASLKKLMGKFGNLIGGLQISELKDKEIDWDMIDFSIQDLDKLLKEMLQIDKDKAYKTYTDLLSSGLADLKNKARKRNKKIYQGFDKLTNTCFQCHAMHRPVDFLSPSKEKPTAKTQ